MNKKKYQYDGWELKFFDNSKNFRNYQLNLIKDHLKGYLAEVGPGTGINLINYYKYPDRIDLFEPSKKLYLKLRRKFLRNKKIKFFNKTFGGKKKYNTIIYLDVIEHIKNDKKEIIKALGLLKKGGNLIINVPAFSHLYSNFDRDVGHYKRYSKNDLKKILRKLTFQKVNFIYYDSIGYLLSILSKIFISDYKDNFEKKIKLWDSLIWVSKIIDIITFRLFGKSLLIIVKK